MPASCKKAVFSLLLLSVVIISVLSNPTSSKPNNAEESDDQAPKTNRETRTFGFRLFDVPREWSNFQQLLRFPQFPQFSPYQPPRQEVNWAFEDDSEAVENLRRRVSDLEIGQRRIVSYLKRLQAQLSSNPGSPQNLPNVEGIIPHPPSSHNSPSTSQPSNIDDRMDSSNSPSYNHDHNPSSPSSSKPSSMGGSGIFTMTSTSTSNTQGPSTMHTINIDIHGPSKPTSPMSPMSMMGSNKDHEDHSSSTSKMDELEDVSESSSNEDGSEVDLHGPGMVVPESTHRPMVQMDKDVKNVKNVKDMKKNEDMKDVKDVKDEKDKKKMEMGVEGEKDGKSPMVEVNVNDEKTTNIEDGSKVEGEKKVRVGLKGWNKTDKKEGDDLLIEFNDIKRSL